MSKQKTQSLDILSFFKRTPGAKPAATTSSGKRRRSTLDADVKPVIGSSASSKGKGKGKAIGGEENPVVISDSDDEGIVAAEDATPSKKPKASSSREKSASISGAPSAFPSFLDYNPPTAWPEIVNTASNPYEIDEAQAEDEVKVIPPETPPVPSRAGSVVPSTILGADDWDEGDEEGMGMEEGDSYNAEDEGDEGDAVSEIVPMETPKQMASSSKVETQSCPICGKSLKGKGSALMQQHVNSCLDSPSTSATAAAHAKAESPSKTPSTSNTKRECSTTPRTKTTITSIKHQLPSPEPDIKAIDTQTTKGPNAFSVLMQSHKEKDEWKTAEIDLKRDGTRSVGRRLAPFYKVMTGMPIAVDAFRYGAIPGVTAYFLTHAHSDHYTNLSKSWKHGPIYCSITTGNLIKHMLGVEPQWVHGLEEDIPFELPNTGGVKVTVLEANHCPGSSLFLFEGRQTVNAGDGAKSAYVGSKRIFRYLHCGDFRACPKIVMHPAVARAKIDVCYLDTTYLNPQYCFPPQPLVITACATLARKTVVGISPDAPPVPVNAFDGTEDDPEGSNERSKKMMQGWLVKKEDADVKIEDGDSEALKESSSKGKGRTLVVIGTYSIGKERIVKGVAKALGSKIYCDPRKKAILLCEADPELHSMLTSVPEEAQVHVVPLGNIQLDRLQPYLHRLQPHFDRVLGFRPTGWTYTPPAGTNTLPDVNFVIQRDQSRTFTDASLKPMRGSSLKYMMFGVPYSEHSSFFELTCFALSLPGPQLRMIATVNVGNEKSRAKMKNWFEKWAAEKAKRVAAGLPTVVEYRDLNFW